jgi:hypothetical protein
MRRREEKKEKEEGNGVKIERGGNGGIGRIGNWEEEEVKEGRMKRKDAP